ncbi:hypothetical protein KSS87_006260, partial [Heliosperma pusillum]
DSVPYFETSAKENVNVDEAFLDIAKVALSKGEAQNIYYENMVDSPSDFEQAQSGGCPC